MADRGLSLLDASALLILLEQRGELRVAADSGAGDTRLRILPVEGSALGAIFRASRPLCLNRPRAADAAWLNELGVSARAALIEPLAMADDGSGLVIALRRDGPDFRSADQEALRAFAGSVTQRVAAERSAEIERLRHGLEAQERERTRWAREIHDETIQGLGALHLQLANARDEDDPDALRAAVEAVLEGLGAEIDGLRHLVTELRPAALDDLGLVPALEAIARRAWAIDALEVETDLRLASDERVLRLDPELEGVIYRVVQEALMNVAKHARARRALVRLMERDGNIHVSVGDDGSGRFDSPDAGSGFGLAGMRERAALVGGELVIDARPGAGTTVRLQVPLGARRLRTTAGGSAGPVVRP
jgi:signal transduction histidine kinase